LTDPSAAGGAALTASVLPRADGTPFAFDTNTQGVAMERIAINPTSFSVGLGFDQALLITGRRRELICSAQDSVDETGTPVHPGDLAAQLAKSLDNLEAVLAEAQMALSDVVRLNIFTTELSTLFRHFSATTDRFNGSRFATTVLGVPSLAGPDLMVALEATAMD
jgi:enamine deaminase RidA (YjgF/YER057c/UK114 family)